VQKQAKIARQLQQLWYFACSRGNFPLHLCHPAPSLSTAVCVWGGAVSPRECAATVKAIPHVTCGVALPAFGRNQSFQSPKNASCKEMYHIFAYFPTLIFGAAKCLTSALGAESFHLIAVQRKYPTLRGAACAPLIGSYGPDATRVALILQNWRCAGVSYRCRLKRN
jgi:hypothetical protein